jgi:hypothetical protein
MTLVTIEEVAGWATEPGWMLKREKYLILLGV